MKVVAVFVLGLFFGWNLPQPEFSKKIWDFFASKIKDITGQN